MTTAGEWLSRVVETAPAPSKVIGVDQLPSAIAGSYRNAPRLWDGESYPGGYGVMKSAIPDLWTLRERSVELFETNPYARGLIRRLITNEVNTGLELACIPEEVMLGMSEGALDDWTDEVENRFHIWSRQPRVCDWNERDRLGAIQAHMRQAALVSGDVLVVLRMDRRTGLPRIQLVDGRLVMSPIGANAAAASDGKRITHGVEMDSRDRHVAFWVLQADGTHRRLPAYGARSGRKQAWLVYGTDHRLNEVRGRPLLSLFLQMLKEVDRYRDAALRKAVINSLLAMFIKKDQDKISTLPISGGATKVGTDVTVDEMNVERSFSVADVMPGLVIEELNPGETPEAFGSHGTDEKYGAFEEAMLRTYAWANQLPPEILLLGFSSNYSASQAANNEFKIYLNPARAQIGQGFLAPIYQEWILSEALNGNVVAPGLVEAFRARAWDTWGAWTSSEWWGHIKPSIDILKTAKGMKEMVAVGWTNHELVSRELTGTKHSKNIRKLKKQNEMIVEANKVLQPPEAEQENDGDSADPDADDRREERDVAAS